MTAICVMTESRRWVRISEKPIPTDPRAVLVRPHRSRTIYPLVTGEINGFQTLYSLKNGRFYDFFPSAWWRNASKKEIRDARSNYYKAIAAGKIEALNFGSMKCYLTISDDDWHQLILAAPDEVAK